MAKVALQLLQWQSITVLPQSVVPDAVPDTVVQGWVTAGSVIEDPDRANIPVVPIQLTAITPPRQDPTSIGSLTRVKRVQ